MRALLAPEHARAPCRRQIAPERRARGSRKAVRRQLGACACGHHPGPSMCSPFIQKSVQCVPAYFSPLHFYTSVTHCESRRGVLPDLYTKAPITVHASSACFSSSRSAALAANAKAMPFPSALPPPPPLCRPGPAADAIPPRPRPLPPPPPKPPPKAATALEAITAEPATLIFSLGLRRLCST